MTFKLEFHHKALDEWNDLDESVRNQLKKKLKHRLENPRVPGDKLSGSKDRYKIKMKRPGIRLVYEVVDETVVVRVVAIGKRERSVVYKTAKKR